MKKAQMSKVYILEDDPSRMVKFDRHMTFADVYLHRDNAAQFIEAIERDGGTDTPIDVMFLDHDLGGEQMVSSALKNTGMEVVRWMVENKPDVRLVIVHTLNPSAGEEMIWRLKDAGYHTVRSPFYTLDFDGDLLDASLVYSGKVNE